MKKPDNGKRSNVDKNETKGDKNMIHTEKTNKTKTKAELQCRRDDALFPASSSVIVTW